MEKINSIDEITNLKDNKVIGKIGLQNASIEFRGNNNILYISDKVEFIDCKIRFTANNSLIYIDSDQTSFSLNIRIGNDSVFYLGKKAYINKTSNIYATERKNIIIGDEFMCSYGVCFRTADPHIIYDVNTGMRTNPSKSILIGDHVWIGQDCLILKNTNIGSGSIIGGNSVVSSKEIASNNLYAGNPAKKIKDGVCYFSSKSTHDYTEEQEKASMNYNSSIFKYSRDKETISLLSIDADLQAIKTAELKIEYIKKNISNNKNKNRFYL